MQNHLDAGADPIIFNGSFGAAGKNRDAIEALKRNPEAYEALGVRYMSAPAGTNPFADTALPARDVSAAARSVYQGADMSIYELPHAAPYFETSGDVCTLRVIDRRTLVSHCTSATRLIRREAFYPGWSVAIDGIRAELRRAGDLFQSVDLPAGTHQVVFRYEPSHAWWILAGLVAGIAAWLAALPAELKRKCKTQPGLDSSSAITMASSRPSRAG